MTQINQKNLSFIDFSRIFLTVIMIYSFLAVSFYFLAGDQLRFRESRGNISLPAADSGSGTGELTRGIVVEQTFYTRIQRLESISVQFGGHYRENHGTITMELWRGGELLIQRHFNALTVQEGTILTMTSDQPIEKAYDVPLLIKIYSDSLPGDSLSPLITTKNKKSGYSLTLNGRPLKGALCFSARGTDYIWGGLQYWNFTLILGVMLSLWMFSIWNCYCKGKLSYVIDLLAAMKKYHFLIRQLVVRDFKKKYKRSILGMFWSFLNPLLTMLVQYFVFSTIFKRNQPYFAAYLIIGTVLFGFFTESVGMALSSILDNAKLITKVYMPRYIYPLTRVLSSLVNFAISLIPMFIVCMFTGVKFRQAAILSLFFMGCLMIFCLGFGMLLATSMVFFRDTKFLWKVMSMMWMYATPIFYPESILPDKYKIIFLLNPLYHFIKNVRLCILSGLSPEPVIYFQCLMISLIMLAVGAFMFSRHQNKFVLYL